MAKYDVDSRMTEAVNSWQSRRSEYDYDASSKRVWERRTAGRLPGVGVFLRPYTHDATFRRLKKIEKYPLGMGFAADACQTLDS